MLRIIRPPRALKSNRIQLKSKSIEILQKGNHCRWANLLSSSRKLILHLKIDVNVFQDTLFPKFRSWVHLFQSRTFLFTSFRYLSASLRKIAFRASQTWCGKVASLSKTLFKCTFLCLCLWFVSHLTSHSRSRARFSYSFIFRARLVAARSFTSGFRIWIFQGK